MYKRVWKCIRLAKSPYSLGSQFVWDTISDSTIKLVLDELQWQYQNAMH